MYPKIVVNKHLFLEKCPQKVVFGEGRGKGVQIFADMSAKNRYFFIDAFP